MEQTEMTAADFFKQVSNLLKVGTFQGQHALAVVQATEMLDKMAVEASQKADAKANA